MSTKGTRVLMDLEDYSKEQQTKALNEDSELPKNEEKTQKIEKLTILGMRKMTGESIRSILSLPFYLLFSQSPAFIQLNRSLVLKQSLASVSLTEIPGILFPFTSNCCYLFVERFPRLEMVETDCSDCVNEGSTDLFAFWNHELEPRFYFCLSFDLRKTVEGEDSRAFSRRSLSVLPPPKALSELFPDRKTRGNRGEGDPRETAVDIAGRNRIRSEVSAYGGCERGSEIADQRSVWVGGFDDRQIQPDDRNDERRGGLVFQAAGSDSRGIQGGF